MGRPTSGRPKSGNRDPQTGGSVSPAARRFAPADRERLERAKILGVRSGAGHKYTGVWVVMVEGRVFVRSWNDSPTG